jgi:hypothetical protein
MLPMAQLGLDNPLRSEVSGDILAARVIASAGRLQITR